METPTKEEILQQIADGTVKYHVETVNPTEPLSEQEQEDVRNVVAGVLSGGIETQSATEEDSDK